MALISLQFRESPATPSPLASRTEADLCPLHREKTKRSKILTEQCFREMLVRPSSAGFDAFFMYLICAPELS